MGLLPSLRSTIFSRQCPRLLTGPYPIGNRKYNFGPFHNLIGYRRRTYTSVVNRSDFLYMVPPFLAYYGVITRNRTMVGEAYKQVKLYRQYLRDPSQGLWRHIVLGTSLDEPPNDPGFWATGGLLLILGKIKLTLLLGRERVGSIRHVAGLRYH
jgi:hypothetical protein